jgi:hypothetical protein
VIRFAIYLALVFLALGVLRVARLLLDAGAGRRRPSRPSPSRVESEMVRDPVCGTWIDRRLALAGMRAGRSVPVCSEKCRRALEAG